MGFSIRLNKIPEVFDIHSDLQAAYLKEEDPGAITRYVPHLPDTERSKPRSLCLRWTVERDKGEKMPTRYRILLGRCPDLSDGTVYFSHRRSLDVKNLYIGSTYYWRVGFEVGERIYQSKIASFQTANIAPRNLDIEGVTNCRDMGGWKTVDGRRVRQGLIFRIGRLNEGKRIEVTRKGKTTLTDLLGIRCEIELREKPEEIVSNGRSVLGEKVRYCDCRAHSCEVVFMEAVIPKILRIFANAEKEPIAFHCSIGTDRTGTVSYLLLALLGVSEKDLYRDYCFSNFGYLCPSNTEHFPIRVPAMLQRKFGIETAIKAQAGNTLQEKARNYLKSLGMTDAELDRIVEMLLE